MTVSATDWVDASALQVFEFLAWLPGHRLIAGQRLRLLDLTADRRGGRIVIMGPFGLRRTVRTAVTCVIAPSAGTAGRVGGSAATGPVTSAQVRWLIEPAGERARVTLTATITRMSVPDRLLLAIGGRRWLARGFAQSIALLGTAVGAQVVERDSNPAG